MTLDDYGKWRGIAARFSRHQEEAEDLLQDCLLIAAGAGRLDFASEENRRWFTGVLRNRAAMTARSEARRKVREEKAVGNDEAEVRRADRQNPDLFATLPTSLRRLAILMLHGMTRREIEFALNLSPTAYRQRLSSLRKRVRAFSPDDRAEAIAAAYAGRTGEPDVPEFGLIRRALLRSLRFDSEVGTHDPDGHPIVLNLSVRDR